MKKIKQWVIDILNDPRETYRNDIIINDKIKELKERDLLETGLISDGYHTFDELYFHRMRLFSIICKQNKEKAWRSKLHDDGTMYENYFIVGITTDKGDYTYHYHMEHWGHFEGIKELDKAPVYDGHKPKDIWRLDSLIS